MQIQNELEIPIANEILNQTDRASAIIATAYLEDKFNLLLMNRLTRDEGTKKAFMKLTEPSAQLGSFGTKVELGYLLGLYGPDTRKDLVNITKIRNRFAHLSEVLDFGDDAIRNRCENLGIFHRFWKDHPAYTTLEQTRPFDKTKARQEFINSVSILANCFLGIVDGIDFGSRLG